MMEPARILIVEDEAIIAMDLSSRLRNMGHVVVATAATGAMALKRAIELRPELVLMDIVLQGDLDGIETTKLMRQQIDVPVVYLTSHSDPATIRLAVGTEPFGYLLKPFNERELQASIQVALYRHRTEAKLRKLERWMSATISSIGDAVIATDLQGKVTLINPAAQQLTGWDESAAVGRPFHEVFNALASDKREPARDLIATALDRGVDIGLNERVILRSRDGRELHIDDSAAPIRGDDGQATGVVVVFRDCSERMIAEQAQLSRQHVFELSAQQSTAQLAAANRALSAFSFSVTHDLRPPLRAVASFSATLAERYGDVLDSDGQRFLAAIHRKSSELESMIDGFIQLDRLRHASLSVVPLDLNAMLCDVLVELAAQQPRAAQVVVEPLPTVMADAASMRMLWQHLLSNALKFTAQCDPPDIRVSGELQGETAVFRVADNGEGFDMAQSSPLALLFSHLHNGQQFDGRGVGLAIVNAVAERHHASVAASGQTGLGATFELRWPAVQLPPA